MEYLPLELDEEILLHAPLENIKSLCRANKDYYNLCSDYRFWLRRIREENLFPYLIEEEGKPASYIQAYKDTIRSTFETKKFLQSLPNGDLVFLTINLSLINSPRVILVPGVDANTVEMIYENSLIISTVSKNIKSNIPSETKNEYLTGALDSLNDFLTRWSKHNSIFLEISIDREEDWIDYVLHGGEHSLNYIEKISFPSLQELIFHLSVADLLGKIEISSQD